MLVDTRADRIDITPRDDRVDERVAAAAGEIPVLPAETAQVIRVVVEIEIALHVATGRGTRHLRIAREHGGLLDREERVGTDLPPRHGRVFDGDEIRMRAKAPLRAELQ